MATTGHEVARPARSRLVAPLAALVVLGLVWAILGRDEAAADAPLQCRPAVLVDGRLACGSEGSSVVAQACKNPTISLLRDGDAVSTAGLCDGGSGRIGRMPAPMLRALGVVLDVNEADAADLQSLPGVGPVLARRIVEGRPYDDVEALRAVRGVGPVTLARIRPRVRVGAPPRVQPGVHPRVQVGAQDPAQ